MSENSFITRMKSKPETRALLELYVGIIICSLVFLFLGVFFAKPRLHYFLGVLVGALGAAYQAYGIYDTLDKALSSDKDSAKKYGMIKSMARLLISFLLMIIGIFISYAMFAGVVLGLMTLKLSGVLNPIIKTKILKHKDELFCEIQKDTMENNPFIEEDTDEKDLSESEYHKP